MRGARGGEEGRPGDPKCTIVSASTNGTKTIHQTPFEKDKAIVKGHVNKGFTHETYSNEMTSDGDLRRPEGKIRTTQSMRFTSIDFSKHENAEKEKESWGCRHTLVLMVFLGVFICYATRVCLSVAIVAMVGTRRANNSTSLRHNLTSDEVCPPSPGYDLQVTTVIEGEFDWDEQTQGFALGAFFWGYTVANLLGGRASELLGGRLVFGGCVIISSLLSIASPFSAWMAKECFIAVRALAGAFQGGIFPAVNTLYVAWINPEDRSKFTSIGYTGIQVGTLVSMSASGWLCDSGFLGGWPSPFYVFGVLGCLWGIPWFFLIRNNHQDHPRVSQAEIAYISRANRSVNTKEVLAIPYKEMAKSMQVWSIIAANFGSSYGFYMMLTAIPTYLSNILHFDLKQNGLLSALPYLCMVVWCLSWGAFADWLTRNGKLSIKNLRKLSNAIGCYMPVIGLIVLSFVNCNASVAVVTICIVVSMISSCYCGYMNSAQDIAPRLAGTIYGLANSFGSLSGFISPAITGALTEGNQTPAAWRMAFLISAAFVFIPSTIYIIFISDQVQPWSDPKMEKEREEPAI